LLQEEIDPQRTQQQEQVGDDEELVSDRHVQKRHASAPGQPARRWLREDARHREFCSRRYC
jgi:hypothetical protein